LVLHGNAARAAWDSIVKFTLLVLDKALGPSHAQAVEGVLKTDSCCARIADMIEQECASGKAVIGLSLQSLSDLPP